MAQPASPVYLKAKARAPDQPWRRPMQDALVVRRETHIPAPRAAVFALLTDPEKILRWMGTEAQLEPRGGSGASPRLQLWLGRQRGGATGIEPGRDRPDGAAAGRNAAASDPYR